MTIQVSIFHVVGVIIGIYLGVLIFDTDPGQAGFASFVLAFLFFALYFEVKKMKTTRIDQYICIDIDRIIVDEMKEIVDNDSGSHLKEDISEWKRLQDAAKVILEFYRV